MKKRIPSLVQFFKNLIICFTSQDVQQEYVKIKKKQATSFFKIALVMTGTICLYTNILSIINDSHRSIIAYSLLTFACLLTRFFAQKLLRFIDQILFIVSVALLVMSYISVLHSSASAGAFAAPFIMGYIYGSYERITSLSMPSFHYKIIFTLIGLIIRISIFPSVENHLIIYQVLVYLLSVVIDSTREREDRKLFQQFYDFREGLTKFKNLLVSGLPTNVLIMSRDLKRELFKNECISNTVKDKPTLHRQGTLASIYEWLNNLIIDKNSLEEVPRSMKGCSESGERPMTIYEFLEEINKNNFSLREQGKFALNCKSKNDASGATEAYETQIFPLNWDGNEAVALILNNVTEQYQNMALKAADQNKDKMLAMISHELRTPLNGVLGVVNILKKEIKDPQQLRYLTVCHNSGELLFNLVNSILDLQQIRDKKFVLNFARDNLHELLRGIFDLFKFQFDQKGLSLRLDISHDVPEQIITDQNRLRQILINLVGNALKFTSKGGVIISVLLDTEHEDSIRFSVTDTGMGIPEADLRKLFKMYGRLEQRNPRANTTGIGFGLEISNQLARLLSDDVDQGDIKVESELNKGTTFTFFVKDKTVSTGIGSNSGSQEIHYYEPAVFSEGIEDVSLKISPYTSIDIFNNEKSSGVPRIVGLTNSHSELNSSRVLMKSMFYSGSPPKDGPSHMSFSGKIPSNSGRPRKFSQHRMRGNTTPVHGSKKNDSHNDFSIFSPKHCRRKRMLTEFPKRPRILLVDDNPFNLLVAKHFVEALGYHVDTVLSGERAIEEVKNCTNSPTYQPYCVILMDLQMPVMDGYETTKELRKMMGNKEIPEIPIIAVSANDTEDDKKKCKEVGMLDHLSKPLREEFLMAALNRVFSMHSSVGSFTELEDIQVIH